MKISNEMYQSKYQYLIKKFQDFSKLESLPSEDLKAYLNNAFGYSSTKFEKIIMSFLKHGCLSTSEMDSLINICTKIKKLENSLSKNTKPRKKKKLKYTQDQIQEIDSMIEEFIESGKVLSEYLNEINKTKGEWNYFLEILKRIEDPLYNTYRKYIIKQEEEVINTVLSLAPKMLDNLILGVELDSGEKRDFDIIDYYMETNIPLHEFYKLVKREPSFDISMIRYLGTFYGQMRDRKLTNNEILNFLNFDTEINCSRDSEGFPISKTGLAIPLEDKIEILYTLSQYNIPLTTRVKIAALTRYKNGYPIKKEAIKQYVK